MDWDCQTIDCGGQVGHSPCIHTGSLVSVIVIVSARGSNSAVAYLLCWLKLNFVRNSPVACFLRSWNEKRLVKQPPQRQIGSARSSRPIPPAQVLDTPPGVTTSEKAER